MAAPKKTGRKPGSTKFRNRLPDKEMLEIKQAVVDLIDTEVVENLSQAARHLGLSPSMLHSWCETDHEWRNQVQQAQQIIADNLEEVLDAKQHVLGLIFRLKKFRPEYRDNYKIVVTNPKVEELLDKLHQLGQQPPAPQTTQEEESESIPNPFTSTVERMKALNPSSIDSILKSSEAES